MMNYELTQVDKYAIKVHKRPASLDKALHHYLANRVPVANGATGLYHYKSRPVTKNYAALVGTDFERYTMDLYRQYYQDDPNAYAYMVAASALTLFQASESCIVPLSHNICNCIGCRQTYNLHNGFNKLELRSKRMRHSMKIIVGKALTERGVWYRKDSHAEFLHNAAPALIHCLFDPTKVDRSGNLQSLFMSYKKKEAIENGLRHVSNRRK